MTYLRGRSFTNHVELGTDRLEYSKASHDKQKSYSISERGLNEKRNYSVDSGVSSRAYSFIGFERLPDDLPIDQIRSAPIKDTSTIAPNYPVLMSRSSILRSCTSSHPHLRR